MFQYTGVGSRDISEEEEDLIFNLAYHLASIGGRLRSGNAPGSDLTFEGGHWQAYLDGLCNFLPEIYVPWTGFEHGDFPGKHRYMSERNLGYEWRNAAQLISKIHPAWDYLKRGARALHTRNGFQPLGPWLSHPSKFLLACSDVDRKGIPKGGTRTAWVLANDFGIPCFNLRGKTLHEAESFIDSIIW